MSTLTLTISNIEEEKGQLMISIFDNAADFPTGGKEVKFVIVETVEKESTMVDIDLPHGDYAIALLHDLNLDGECNFNFIGIPTEGYGFSQNVRPILSVPSFEDTKFHLHGNAEIEIKLIQ